MTAQKATAAASETVHRQTRRDGGGRERPAERRRMEATVVERAWRSAGETAPELESDDERDERAATVRAHRFAGRERGGERRRARMVDRLDVRVIEIEAVRQRAVDQRRRWRGQPRAEPDRGRIAAGAEGERGAVHGGGEVHPRGRERDAERIEEVPSRQRAHVVGHVLPAEIERERGELLGHRGHRQSRRRLVISWAAPRSPTRRPVSSSGAGRPARWRSPCPWCGRDAPRARLRRVRDRGRAAR